MPGTAAAGDLSTVPAPELVRQLASSSFRERDAAQSELERRGAAVVDALGLGLASEDREVRRRCQDLLRRIEDAEMRAEVLAPHPIRLRFDKTLLSTALLDIGDRTGLQIVALPALSGRRISVDTGELPFWQAWERLCKEACFCESNTTFAQPGRNDPEVRVQDGEPASPTSVRSPLRVRAVSIQEGERGISAEKQYGGPVATLLEIRAEPHLELLAIESVRIRKARDHNGKLLEPSGPVAQRPVSQPELLVDASGRPVLGKASWVIPVWLPGLTHLQRPRELAGVIEARFLVRRNCLSVPAPLQAVGKTFAGKRGASLAVRAVELHDDGMATFTLHLDHLDGLLAAGPGDHLQRVRPGVVIVRDPLAALLDGLELHDAKGRPLPREKFVPPDAAGECRITFANVPQDGKGLRLVLMAWQTVRMEVEFALGK